MDIKEALLKMFLFNKWLCKSESAIKTSKMIARFKRYLAISISFAEVINSLFIQGFSLVFICNRLFETGGLGMPSYRVFDAVSVWWFVAFFMLGVLQLIAMIVPSLRAVKASGLCQIASSLAWGVICGAYYAAQNGMITPATVIFGIWAAAMFFTGNGVLKTAISKGRVTTTKEA